ncbi:hypothetical protein KGY72_08320 [Candidatus Bipolaricaulota bacterium]|nr:hypothetical protein [Candidatus Bipolaricaulota bacterium]MBS3793118.1 hypothetical protein [Candidatus Bipolaricaulota bacterium]
MRFTTNIKTIIEQYSTEPVFFIAVALVFLTLFFLFWTLHRWLRQKRLSRGDELTNRIKRILTGQPEEKKLLVENPRKTTNIVFDLLSNSVEEEREELLTYLEVINFREALEDIKIRSKEEDYSLLVVTAALGLNKGWKTALKWLDQHGSWQWTAAIHALSYWPGHNADQVLVSEMASLSERYQITDRAFNQPIIGALAQRGKRTQELAMDFLTPYSPPNLQLLFLMFFKEIEEIDPAVKESLEARLSQFWSEAGDEIKASILRVGAKHGLDGLVPVAKDAIGAEVDFVQLWAVRLLAKCSSRDDYLDKVRKKGSQRAKREVDVLDPGS